MLEHQHLIVRAEIQNPPDSNYPINDWLTALVSKLNMKVMMGPISSYCSMIGNRGLTGIVVIETSHIALHTWDEESPSMLQLDVYSCSKVDLNVVWEAIKEFRPLHIDYKFLDRKDKYITLL